MSSAEVFHSSESRQRTARVALILAFAIIGELFAARPGAAQEFKVIYSFEGGTDGANPLSSLIQDSAGNLYGTTVQGGAYGEGTVFKLNIEDQETVLYSFMGGTDGANPAGALVLDSAGNLYGTTEYGGNLTCTSYGCGTLFEINTSGTETVLHAFGGGSDGTFPTGGLLRDSAGDLYGTTSQGGSGLEGTVFELASNLTYSVLANFNKGIDGRNPAAGLVEDASGNLYGTTQNGGIFDAGTVFKVSSGGVKTILYNFTGGGDGSTPGYGALIMDSSGNLYGTTIDGGAYRYGTIFELDTSGRENVLYSFTGGADGASPYGGVFQDPYVSYLYGTAFRGGENSGFGVVFKYYTIAPQITVADHTFLGGSDGGSPVAGLIWGTGGSFYGTTSIGGANDAGVVFELSDLALGQHLDFDGDAGTDYTFWRPSNGTWYVQPTFGGTPIEKAWGENGDIIAPGDYDGDGIADYAIFRPSTGEWWVMLSNTGAIMTQSLGMQGDIPVPGDYDGLGMTDYAVWRPSNGTWYVDDVGGLVCPGGTYSATCSWGTNGDIPVPGDYNGDGRTDLAVWRPSNGTWYVVYSLTGEIVTQQWGESGDIPVPGDYDGDGKTDFAVWRPSNGTWYIIYSSTGQHVQYAWGTSGDIPVPRDYDGDNKFDYAVWRPSNGTWYVIYSSTGQPVSVQWGTSTDVPVNQPTGQQ